MANFLAPATELLREELSKVVSMFLGNRYYDKEDLEAARDFIQLEIWWNAYEGFDETATPEDRFKALLAICDYEAHGPSREPEIIEGNLALPYQEFLQSTYWEVVRNYVRSVRGPTCQLCNKGGQLNTHHRTYAHHGSEHRHLDDLIILCRSCHAKFHDKPVGA